jgi:hypothetical protein
MGLSFMPGTAHPRRTRAGVPLKSGNFRQLLRFAACFE